MAVDPEAREIEICTAIVDEINTAIGSASGTVTDATNAEPIVITANAEHGLVSGATVAIAGVDGNPAANGSWAVEVVDATRFSLTGSFGNGAYTSGGTWSGNRFTAQQAYSTDYRLSQLAMIRVDVRIVPESEMTASDRQDAVGSTENVYKFEVSVQKAIAVLEVEAINDLVRLMKRIQRTFWVNSEPCGNVVVKASEVELYNQVCLRDHGHFHGRLNLSLQDWTQ